MSRCGQADVSRCLAGRKEEKRKSGKKVREKKDEEVSERQMAFKKRKAQRNRFTTLSAVSLEAGICIHSHDRWRDKWRTDQDHRVQIREAHASQC